ncbi:hypothetical protein [Amycolatopsis sp. NPDC054798]
MSTKNSRETGGSRIRGAAWAAAVLIAAAGIGPVQIGSASPQQVQLTASGPGTAPGTASGEGPNWEPVPGRVSA